MPGVNITDIVLGTATAATAGFAALSLLVSRNNRNDKIRDEHVRGVLAPYDTRISHLEEQQRVLPQVRDERIHSILAPYATRVTHVEDAQRALPELIADRIEAALSRGLEPLRADVAVLKNQVEIFWRAVGVDMAKIIHSPDPARRHIDKLLESYMEGTLTPEENTELRKILVVIRSWEPGQDAGFPVREGEQTAAALLLAMMQVERVR